MDKRLSRAIFRPDLENGNNLEKLFVLKRFKGVSYYENFLIEKVAQALSDYGMDRLHISDSICPPACGMKNGLSQYKRGCLKPRQP